MTKMKTKTVYKLLLDKCRKKIAAHNLNLEFLLPRKNRRFIFVLDIYFKFYVTGVLFVQVNILIKIHNVLYLKNAESSYAHRNLDYVCTIPSKWIIYYSNLKI